MRVLLAKGGLQVKLHPRFRWAGDLKGTKREGSSLTLLPVSTCMLQRSILLPINGPKAPRMMPLSMKEDDRPLAQAPMDTMESEKLT